jgi:hypothetical protein
MYETVNPQDTDGMNADRTAYQDEAEYASRCAW